MKLVRGVSGAVAAGLVVLACVVVGAALIGARRGFPGPGAESIGWHIVIAAVAVAAQLYSDRKRGTASLAVAALMVGAATLLLWTQWWG
ncbi:hypothetical protein [Nocardia sp. NPDC051750]|uniref:hypothetical protein n=1 Tax=Nocardia sp. NPDC051750 TaxID=3364325 RepID=UPI0037B3C0D0